MDKKWRIGAVSYLNTRPLLLGMEQSPFKERIDLMKSYPAQIAQALLDDTIDIGLVPVAIMPLLKNPQVISKYVIGTEGGKWLQWLYLAKYPWIKLRRCI